MPSLSCVWGNCHGLGERRGESVDPSMRLLMTFLKVAKNNTAGYQDRQCGQLERHEDKTKCLLLLGGTINSPRFPSNVQLLGDETTSVKTTN